MNGVACGIKESGKLDVSVFASERPAVGAGVYTQNQVVGAPVLVSRDRTPSDAISAIVINSGNANACTGERGLNDAEMMTSIVAEQLSTASENVLVCSTGVIGHFLPMENVSQGIRAACQGLGSQSEQLTLAAKGIMTTDTFEKIASQTLNIDGQEVRITGVAKGAAMIAPNMATMLAVVMTDYSLPKDLAGGLLRTVVDQSFNCISVEGHTSTSDSVLLLANGSSGVQSPAGGPHVEFIEGLIKVCQELAQLIIRDAEGAQHFVKVAVTGLPEVEQARRVAKAVCDSPLVKTAITGNDPNWGRIVSAAGYAGVPFLERDLSLEINDVVVYDLGRPLDFDEVSLSQSMAQGEVDIQLKFRLGNESVTYWTCDLTSEYIRLNADYTT
ncbi:Arginine biosynthesis bifunctional protein ArgJ [Thalassoglobus neptunius]|uniref:Arginine biosynthesis bifunctional protein ArgJ n=2 Tax=Thalassoglobus neptunius TaxID=1938619 RepID=A0A5C5X8G0_9PLAN|nr:Arginine biosynthesis bifunctional protein ArgJ [Thalassoglobus neptunius]